MKKTNNRRVSKTAFLNHFKLNDFEKEIYEKSRFSLLDKIKFYSSKKFREKMEYLISEFDFQSYIYNLNQMFQEVIEESESFMYGQVDITRAFKKETVPKDLPQKQYKRKSPKSYSMYLHTLKKLNRYYDEVNVETYKIYKQHNLKRLVATITNLFDEGAEYIIILKRSGQTNIVELEKKLPLELENGRGILYKNKCFSGEYFIGIAFDGCIIKKDGFNRDIVPILKDGFSGCHIFEVAIQSYY